jgi:hypothetical protein
MGGVLGPEGKAYGLASMLGEIPIIGDKRSKSFYFIDKKIQFIVPIGLSNSSNFYTIFIAAYKLYHGKLI